MSVTPFAGWRPALGVEHARWVVAGLHEPPGVGFRVPAPFTEAVRVHHAIEGGHRWADVAPHLLHPAGATWPGHHDDLHAEEGTIDDAVVEALLPVLRAATTTPADVHVGLWEGSGWLRTGTVLVASAPGAPLGARERRLAQEAAQREQDERHAPVRAVVDPAPTLPWWGGRPMRLLDGPLDAVRTLGVHLPAGNGTATPRLRRLGPQWWWPEDRAWFVACEIDDPWTYVAGAGALLDAVEGLGFEAVRVARDDPW